VGRQLLLLIGAWFVICLLGWGISRVFHYLPSSTRLEANGDEFWWVVSRVLGLDYCADVSTYWQRGLFVLLAFVGSFLLTGGVVSLFVTTCTKRMDAVRNGIARYSFKNHSVVVGWNSFSAPIIRQLWEKHGKDPGYEILVLSNLDTPDVSDEIRSMLSGEIEDRVYVYNGNPNSQEEIDGLNLGSAKDVIILGDADGDEADGQNLQTAGLIAAHLKQRAQDEALPCFVQVQNLHLYGLLEQYEMLGRDPNRINLYPFNFYEDWARQVLVNFERLSTKTSGKLFIPLDYRPLRVDSPYHIHLVISDFGHMGMAFLLQAVRMCHYANGSTMRVTVIDERMQELQPAFCAAYPQIFNIPDVQVELINGALESETVRQKLVGWAQEKDALLSIAVCGSDDDQSLRRALTLPKEVHQREVPVFVRRDMRIGFSNMVKTSNIRFFGEIEECCDIDRVQDRMAQVYHEAYRAQRRADGTFNAEEAMCGAWKTLLEEVRRTNRNLADMIPLKLRAIGCDAIEGQETPDGYVLSSEDVEILARIEHNRWAADRLLAGWEQGTQKDNALRISPYLIPYDELTEEIKEYDRIPARKIAELLDENLNLKLVKTEG